MNDEISWRLMKKNKHSSPKTIPLKHNNKTITDPIEKAELLHSTLCHPNDPNLAPKHIKFHKLIDSKMNTFTPKISTNLNPFDTLNSPIQKYEVTNCIHDLDRDKAYGPDMIHNQMLINGGPVLWSQLLLLFNNVYKQHFSKVWNFANVCPI